MSYPVRFLPEARREYDDAVDWYERQRPTLGIAFIAAVDTVVERLADTPRLHATVYQHIRQAPVRRFPYVVLYQEEAEEVLIIGVFHTSRDPTVWQGRV